MDQPGLPTTRRGQAVLLSVAEESSASQAATCELNKGLGNCGQTPASKGQTGTNGSVLCRAVQGQTCEWVSKLSFLAPVLSKT